MGLICKRVHLATGSWSSWVVVAGGGVALGHGVVQRARVRWAMGLSMSAVSFSVVFLVSVSGMMPTLGAE